MAILRWRLALVKRNREKRINPSKTNTAVTMRKKSATKKLKNAGTSYPLETEAEMPKTKQPHDSAQYLKHLSFF